jgi:hypothetical protein
MVERRHAIRTAIRPPAVNADRPAPGDSWAVHRTAIDVALAFERSMVSAARSKDRQTRLKRAGETPRPEDPSGFSGT